MTRTIPRNKFKDDEFCDRVSIHKQFADRKTKEVKIYYCRFDRRTLLESERVLLKTNKGCKRYDN